MRITVEDTSMVNWDEVHKRVTSEVQEMVTAAVNRAQAVLSELKPGERRTVTIKVGSLTVARPK